MSDLCPVCGNPSKNAMSSYPSGFSINCPRCGHYFINDMGLNDMRFKNDLDWVKLSGFLRNNQRFILKDTNYQEIISKTRMPNPAEKADNILLYLEERYKTPGDKIDLTDATTNIIPEIEGYAYIKNLEEQNYLLREYLKVEKEFVRFEPKYIVITPKGWDYISKLLKPNQDSNTAFIAMWFDPTVKNTRDVIKQSLRDAGYEPKIVDEIEHNDDVTDKIITLINRARFIIADFTEQRAGVYYEAGYAKGINIPVIHTVKENEIEKLHFDINHQNFISWDETNLSEFQKKLTDRITATIGDGPLIINN